MKSSVYQQSGDCTNQNGGHKEVDENDSDRTRATNAMSFSNEIEYVQKENSNNADIKMTTNRMHANTINPEAVVKNMSNSPNKICNEQGSLTNERLCEIEIKQEVVASYSLDGWCELGPSAYEFGHNPDLNTSFDVKDEIKKSPRGERAELEHDNRLDNAFSKNLPTEETSRDGDKNISSQMVSCKESCISNNKLCDKLVAMTENPVSVNKNIENHIHVTKNKHIQNHIDVAKNQHIENHIDVAKNKLIENHIDMTTISHTDNDDNTNNLNQDIRFKMCAADWIAYPQAEIKKENNGASIESKSARLNTESLLETHGVNLILDCEHKIKEKDFTCREKFERESKPILPVENKRLHPISSTSLDTISTSSTQIQLQSPDTFTSTPVSCHVQSVTPPLNSVQSRSGISVPFFAQNFLNSDPLRLSNYPQLIPPAIVSTNFQYSNKPQELTRPYQTWIKPYPLGYNKYAANSTVDKRNENKLMFVTPQNFFLQQLPYTPLISQPSFPPYATPAVPYLINQIPTPPGITASISSHYQTINPVSSSSDNVAGLEEKSNMTSMDEVKKDSGVLDLSSNRENGLGSVVNDVESHEKIQHSDCVGAHYVNIHKTKSIGHDEQEERDFRKDDDQHQLSGMERSATKEVSRELTIPKVSRANDFVDPTQIKFDQDDELGDNSVSLNGDDSSDEEWLPETRDGDKSGDSENDEDTMVEEEEEEGDDDKEEEINLQRNKQQKVQRKQKTKHETSKSNTTNCHFCGKVFHGNYHLKRHLLSHTENRPHQCNACGKRFKQKAHLHGHEIVHLREKSKTRKDKSTNISTSQKNKISSSCYKSPGRPKKVYSEKELSCNVCSKVFKTLYRLKRHVQSHTDIRPYSCKVCGKGFKQTGHRNEHEANHEKNRRKFLCNICGVIFHCRSSFNNHLKTHRSKQCVGKNAEVVTTNSVSGNNAEETTVSSQEVQHTGYDCPYCPDKFATAQGLNRHLDSHVEVHQRLHVQPYSCQVCSRAFTYKHNLTKHMLTHQAPEKLAEFHKSKLKEHLASGRPSYTCSVCSKVFMRKETLAKHSKVHSGTKPFKCEVCQKEFTQNVHLKVHMRKHTGSRPFQCKRCNVGFIDSTALAKHIEYEACVSENMLFHCTICDKRHYYLGSIKQHIKKEHNEKDLDKFISRTVRQKRTRVSNKSNENACRICSKSFSEKVNLIRHVKRKHNDLLKLLNSDTGIIKSERPNHSCYNDESSQKERYMESVKELPGSNDNNGTLSTNENIRETTNPSTVTSTDDIIVDGKISNANMSLLATTPHHQLNQSETEKHFVLGGVEVHEFCDSQTISDEVVVEDSNPRGSEDQPECVTSEKIKEDEACVIKKERDERISEANVNKFLYRIGLVEKSKVGDLVENLHDTGCCIGANSNPCAISLCESLQRPYENNASNLLSGYQAAGRKDVHIEDKLVEGQNQTACGDLRSNLEVFCDLALMTDNRLVNSCHNSITDSSIESFQSGSSYRKEFQSDVNGYCDEDNRTYTQSSATEIQLKQLGVLVCKDAQNVRNRGRPLAELFKEFKPWLEKLLKSSPLHSPALDTTKYNITTSLTSPVLSSVGTLHNISKRTPSMILYKRNERNELEISGGITLSHGSSYGNTNSPSFKTSSSYPLCHNEAAKGSTRVNNSNQGVSTHNTPIHWTSNASQRYEIPNIPMFLDSCAHSKRLKEQLFQYVRNNATTYADPSSLFHTVNSSQPHGAETHDNKQTPAQTQTPLHFDHSPTKLLTSCNNKDSPRSPSYSPLSSTDTITSLFQDSKILHSLLGGVKQDRDTISPLDKNYKAKEDGNIVINACPADTTTTRFVSNSNTTTEIHSHYSTMHEIDSPAPPLQIVTQTRMTSPATTTTPSTSHNAKVKGPFPCQGCGKCFNARHQLKRHEMTHTEIRPYRCAECGKAFRQKVHLSDHLKRHRGQRPFLCTICGKRFVLKNELKQHTKNYCRKSASTVTS